MKRFIILATLVLAMSAWFPWTALAEDAPKPPPTLEGLATSIDTVWLLVSAFLVFFMQAGFACVEAGFTRAKNTCNILAKNFIDFCVASIIFFLVGYAIMFGKGNDFLGMTGFALSDAENPSTVPLYAYWMFQAVFCGTAATIVSGSMAERTKFSAYLCYTFVISAVIYPVIGHWIWGGGWLSQMGFADFAGSTVVHSVGGWMALVGAIMLGPRIGKYGRDGKSKAITGHSISLAAIGVFVLWFGWFGFNPGSTVGATGANLEAIGLIAVNTNLAAAAGGLFAMATVWLVYGKPDVSMTMNGILAGLVAITAPCAYVSPLASIVIGAIGGVLVVGGVALLDKLHIDDPVGAVPVHAFNGVWGTLSVGIWGQKALGLSNDGLLHGGGMTQLGVQALGVLAAAAFAIVVMAIFFAIIKSTVGLRVNAEEEVRGLDIDEHGMEAYSDFQIFTTR